MCSSKEKQLSVQCAWCKRNSAIWFAHHPDSDQDCYYCNHCHFYFVYPHEAWIPSVTDDEGDPETFRFWGDLEAEAAYTLWRSKENKRIADTIKRSGKLGRVLEIGFGEGPLTDILVDDCEEYWGIEPVKASLYRTVERFGLNRDRVFSCTAEDMLNETSLQECMAYFDTVILVSVLEHLSSPRKILDDCYQLLAPGGQLIVSTPDSTFFKALVWIRGLLKMEPWSHFHISFFSPKTLKKGAELAGFIVSSESRHRLVTKESADYFGKLNHSLLLKYIMNCGRMIGLDLFFHVNTLFYILKKPA